MGEPSNQAKAIFLAALKEHAPEQWPAFLEQVCGGDDPLRAKVERLLRARSELGTFHEAPRADQHATVEESDGADSGTAIGPYRLLQLLGEGGMGTVYLAQQIEPVKRLVALKVIKPGMDSKQMLARFETERQALALMDHPNIARVLEAGATASGRPYFVMELVEGLPLTRYCDEHQLTPRERLELFIPVCQAVQHAHQKGIIHRDLKPSNVLVAEYDGKPAPKVIDFGVAKATGQNLTERTAVTSFGAVIGTLAYMSPEQAEWNQLDIDTRSDIYSLGVLLYELLTGTTPLDRQGLKEAGLLEVLRRIREEEPPRPSARLSTTEGLPKIAARRGSEPSKLSGLVRGELDWIVLKALEKDRNRRYETASAFAADVQRYLHDEPVTACPPSVSYRLRKFVRRNRGPVLAAAVFVLLLVAGIVGTTTGLVRARAAERQALTERDAKDEAMRKAVATAEAEKQARRRERQALNTMTDAMMEDLLGQQVRLTDRHREFLKKVLAQHEAFAAASADDAESQQSRAEGYFRVGLIRQRLGELQEAEAAYRQALAISRPLAARFPDRPEFRHEWAMSQNNLALVLRSRGRLPEAEKAFRETLALRQQLVADFRKEPIHRYLLATTYRNLGGLLRDTGRLPEAEKAYREALALCKLPANGFRDRPIFVEERSIVYQNLTVVLVTGGRLPEAEKACRAALALSKRLADGFRGRPEFRQRVALSYFNLGNLLRDTGRLPQAEKAFGDALTILKQLAAGFPNRPEFRRELALGHNNLGNLLRDTKQPKQAEEALRAALALSKGLVADFPNRPDFDDALATSYSNLGGLLLATERQPEAEEVLRAVLAIRKQLATDFPERPDFRRLLAMSYFNLGGAVFASRGPKQAQEVLRKALALHQKLADDFPGIPQYRDDLAHTLLKLGLLHVLRKDFAAAVPFLRQALPQHQAAVKASPRNRPYRRNYRTSLTHLAQCYSELADHVRLATVADELARLGYDPAKDTYEAARNLGLCLVMIMKETKLDQARREELARRYSRRVQALLRQGVAQGNKDAVKMYQVWRDTLKEMAKTHLDVGDHAWLARTANDLAWWGFDPPNDTYHAACFLCRCVGLARKDARLNETERAGLAQSYADRALALLQQAVARGYQDAAHLKRDPDLQPLRARQAFQKLLADLEGKTKE